MERQALYDSLGHKTFGIGRPDVRRGGGEPWDSVPSYGKTHVMMHRSFRLGSVITSELPESPQVASQ